MHLFRKILLLAITISIFSIHVYAAEGWYIVKRGNDIPQFPKDADFISAHSGYYVDKYCRENGDKKIYLTFDAGYENGNVEKILDIMDEYNVKGAFFILSNLVLKNPELVRRMADDGHLVCNHTSNHKDVTRLTKEEMLDNIKSLENVYLQCTGKNMSKYFRFPEGKYSRDAILTCEEAGYKTVFWSMAYDDWDNSRQMSPSRALEKLISTTHNGAIVLLHPTSKTNVEILPRFIEYCINEEYKFATLDEL